MSEDNQTRHDGINDETPWIVAHLPLMAVYQFVRMPDGNGKFTFFGDALKQILGLTPSDVFANPRLLHDCIHESDVPRFLSAWEIATRDTVPLRIIVRQRHCSGKLRVSLIHSFPQQSENGVVVWNGLLLDLTDQFPETAPSPGDGNGHLRVCAWCDKLLGLDPAWQPSKELLGLFNPDHLTHGLCEDCRVKLLKSAD